MAEVETSTEEIVARLVEEFDPEKIILFGSNAWGTPQSGSDLDLLVIVRSATRPPTQRAAQAYRCLQGIKTPVDIIVVTRTELSRYASVPASLSRKILNQGKVLYG